MNQQTNNVIDNGKLEAFANIPDDNLKESKEITQGKASKFYPAADIFNSAGNTEIQDEEETPQPENNNDNRGTSESHKGNVKLGKVISGKNAVAMINIFIPSFVVFAFRRFGYTTTKPQWKLNKEEQETLNPVVQDCLDYIVINFDNPFYALAFVASMVYGAKAMDAIPDLKKLKDEALNDTEAEENRTSKNDTAGQAENANNNARYREFRDRINATSVRKQKTGIVIEAFQQDGVTDLQTAWKTYAAIYPERTEGYFVNDWYAKNIGQMPDNLKFSIPGAPVDNDFNLNDAQ